jgi:transposase
MDTFTPLNDFQWSQLETLFPSPAKRSRGKPHTPWRYVVNSILLVLFTRLKWGAIPNEPQFATKSAAHRWFVLWEKNGFLNQLLETLGMRTEIKPKVSLPPRRQRKETQSIPDETSIIS